MKVTTFEIKLTGRVQGVGFRPFVYQTARAWKLRGEVSNGASGVRIRLTTIRATAEDFLDTLLKSLPPLAHVEQYALEEVSLCAFDSFHIVESANEVSASLRIPPDFALCSSCRTELQSPHDRRFRYPFISCTQCGPRYSMIQAMPYDRPQTSMVSFPLCTSCGEEYQNREDRRFHAQSNACFSCGPQLAWYDVEKKQWSAPAQHPSEVENRLQSAQNALHQGKILAVKGIGGFLLICDATRSDVVATLRRRKHRPTKPLAVLCASLDAAEKEAFVHRDEKNALQSSVAPIVLLKKKERGTLAANVAPQQARVGIMLPYTPLLDLIAVDFGKPLVATSANVSGNPILYQDDRIEEYLAELADFILTNDRPIVVPIDDSVLTFSPRHQRQIWLRRGRGVALDVGKGTSRTTSLLAFGASMKATFGITSEGNHYVSQYLGDLSSFDTQQHFKQVLTHFLHVYHPTEAQPLAQVAAFLCDAHPDYSSTQMAHQLGENWHVPQIKVQHHLAHLAAVLAENELLDSQDPLLGVVWDGLGYGLDGHLWGGEFWAFTQNQTALKNQLLTSTTRFHFAYFDTILGDKMAREPRLSVLSACQDVVAALPFLRGKFSEKEWNLYTKLIAQNKVKTSSVGRIFDAVASLIGLIDFTSYEGEAALLLEGAAASYFDQHGYTLTDHYLDESDGQKQIPTAKLLLEISQDVINKQPQNLIAAKFHLTLVWVIRWMADAQGCNHIACSGGVFQNTLLVDLLIEYLEPEYTLFFHQQLSPNDENIAYGQLVIGDLLGIH